MVDRVTLALCKFLRLDPATTQRVVLTLDATELPRVTVTSLVRPPLGAEAALVRRVRDFDLVPHDERRAQRAELEEILLDLSAGDDEDGEQRIAAGAALVAGLQAFPPIVKP